MARAGGDPHSFVQESPSSLLPKHAHRRTSVGGAKEYGPTWGPFQARRTGLEPATTGSTGLWRRRNTPSHVTETAFLPAPAGVAGTSRVPVSGGSKASQDAYWDACSQRPAPDRAGGPAAASSQNGGLGVAADQLPRYTPPEYAPPQCPVPEFHCHPLDGGNSVLLLRLPHAAWREPVVQGNFSPRWWSYQRSPRPCQESRPLDPRMLPRQVGDRDRDIRPGPQERPIRPAA